MLVRVKRVRQKWVSMAVGIEEMNQSIKAAASHPMKNCRKTTHIKHL
jgi:hypothetical protein